MHPIVYEKEIDQSDNPNAATRLWIQPDGTVYKQYVSCNWTVRKNIKSLLRIAQSELLTQCSHLVMPLEIHRKYGIVEGYLMPFVDGTCLDTYLTDESIEPSMQLEALLQLARVINQLPEDIYIGDLHGKNVLVDPAGKVHLIDIDGFSVSGNEISCPYTSVAAAGGIPRLRKYRHWNGKFQISRDSDILCFCGLVLMWFSGRRDIVWNDIASCAYLEYLEVCGLNHEVLDLFFRLYQPRKNILCETALKKIQLNQLDSYRYSAYVAWQEKRRNSIMDTKTERSYTTMSLRDRIAELDVHANESFYDRADKIAERLANWEIGNIEHRIKEGRYETKWGKKIIEGHLLNGIAYETRSKALGLTPEHAGGSFAYYRVNSEEEAEYLIRAIVSRLEAEGCKCRVNCDSRSRGFLRFFVHYSISYTFKWRS